MESMGEVICCDEDSIMDTSVCQMSPQLATIPEEELLPVGYAMEADESTESLRSFHLHQEAIWPGQTEMSEEGVELSRAVGTISTESNIAMMDADMSCMSVQAHGQHEDGHDEKLEQTLYTEKLTKPPLTLTLVPKEKETLERSEKPEGDEKKVVSFAPEVENGEVTLLRLFEDPVLASRVNHYVATCKETAKMPRDQLMRIVDKFAVGLEVRPRSCQIWMKDLTPAMFESVLQKMLRATVPQPMRRSLFRIELRDVFPSMKALTTAVLNVAKGVEAKVRLSDVFGSQMINPREMLKGRAPGTWYLANEHEMQKYPITFVSTYYLTVPEKKGMSVEVRYQDKTMFKEGKRMRHRYMAIDHIVEQSVVSFADTHTEDIVEIPEDAEFLPTSFVTAPVVHLSAMACHSASTSHSE